MSFQKVERPIPCPRAFEETGDAAILSQAALLLLMGAHFRGDAGALMARATAGRSGRYIEAVPAEDLQELQPPKLGGSAKRIDTERARRRLQRRYGARWSEAADAAGDASVGQEVLADLAKKLYRTRNAEAAAELFEACLRHSHELPRVAAAASYFGLCSAPHSLLDVLANGTQSSDILVRDVAATTLGRWAPDHPRLAELTRGDQPPAGSVVAHTSAIIHGTWARSADWWRPGGGFQSYLRSQVRPDLYSEPDRFEWSGGYSEAARALAADDLRNWILGHSFEGLDLFTHSHGGAIAMLVSQSGVNFGELVLLSCPVHVPRYLPDFSRVTRVVSVRVRLDLVILADGGGQRFRHPQINENVLPLWFDHAATHQPEVWQLHNVPSLL